tara:strand:+ start:2170 stop:2361 length:192 start_codon:yes stop_codon:yes gene_type:complete
MPGFSAIARLVIDVLERVPRVLVIVDHTEVRALAIVIVIDYCIQLFDVQGERVARSESETSPE